MRPNFGQSCLDIRHGRQLCFRGRCPVQISLSDRAEVSGKKISVG